MSGREWYGLAAVSWAAIGLVAAVAGRPTEVVSFSRSSSARFYTVAAEMRR